VIVRFNLGEDFFSARESIRHRREKQKSRGREISGGWMRGKVDPLRPGGGRVKTGGKKKRSHKRPALSGKAGGLKKEVMPYEDISVSVRGAP